MMVGRYNLDILGSFEARIWGEEQAVGAASLAKSNRPAQQGRSRLSQGRIVRC
jgi:hypothetical protein